MPHRNAQLRSEAAGHAGNWSFFITHQNRNKVEKCQCHAHVLIHENWVLNPAGSIEHITALYNSHWKDAGYRTWASTGYMLTFLFNQGRYEEVGAYFRNIEMLRYEADPASYLKDYHLHSRKEGNHGYWKEHLALQKRLRVRGIESVDRYLTRNLCTILAVALNRLQHGVRAHLASVAYLK